MAISVTCAGCDGTFYVDAGQRCYEPQRFDLGWSTYTPDFYLPDLNRWIEVKGAWTVQSKRKFDEFASSHLASAVMARDILAMERTVGAAGLSRSGGR